MTIDKARVCIRLIKTLAGGDAFHVKGSNGLYCVFATFNGLSVSFSTFQQFSEVSHLL